MMIDFAERNVEFHKLPRPEGVILPYPERAILIFEDGHTLDIGALCYLRRMPGIRKTNGGRKVDLSSLSQLRRHEIRVLIAHISKRFAQAGLRKRTEFGRFYTFTLFMDWCDQNQHSRLFDNQLNARAAFRDYVEDLKRRVRQNQLGNNTAVSYQNLTQAILEDYLSADNLDQGIKLLWHSHRLVNPTAIPDNKSQEVVLAWCKCLLTGLSELVVDQKPYPFALSVPGYLKWPDDRIWIFPISAWCSTPDSKKLSDNRSYDYRNGRIYTPKEVEAIHGAQKWPSISVIRVKKAQKIIEKANKDFYCRHRIHRGTLAVSAFFVMYLAATGSNFSQAREVLWNEELEENILNPATERQGFRTIKYRAYNRIVSFEVGIEYMPYLRRYLQLRKYLLQGKHFDYLFFSFGSAYKKESGPEPRLISESETKNLFAIMKRLTPTFPSVVPMQWRAAKQDHLIRHHDPAIAAQVMQHSLITTLRKYSNGSQVNQQLEISSYFSQVEKIVLGQRQKNAGFETNSVGICTNPGKPKAVAENLPTTPDCKGIEGCLFCDKYRVHADDVDVRKLLSARYYIKEISRLTNSQEQYIKLFFATLQRIDFILGELKCRIPELVEKIALEVDIDGELDTFWSGKLEMLMELDLA